MDDKDRGAIKDLTDDKWFSPWTVAMGRVVLELDERTEKLERPAEFFDKPTASGLYVARDKRGYALLFYEAENAMVYGLASRQVVPLEEMHKDNAYALVREFILW